MNLIDEAYTLISNRDIVMGTTDFVTNCVEGLSENPVAIAKVIVAITQMPFSLTENMFWKKYESFLKNTFKKESDRGKLCAKLTKNGAKRNNPYRLIEAINHCDTLNKIQYLVNVSRCLIADIIDLPTFFRCVHIITSALQEDLEFVADNILNKKEYGYCDTVQGLLNCGLMYESTSDANGYPKYSFTPFANVIDMYCLSYDNPERYLNVPIYRSDEPYADE